MTKERFALCNELWRAGIAAETLYSESVKMKEQIEYSINNQVPIMIVIGETELQGGVVQIKKIQDNNKSYISRKDMIAFLQHYFHNNS